MPPQAPPPNDSYAHAHSHTHTQYFFIQCTLLLFSAEAVLQYDVELQESELLTFQGPAILELRDGELIVNRKDSHTEIVKWRLSHIRSFKAKKRLLTIFSGR